MIPGSVFAIVLAAGRGERFGGSKLLAPWRGRPLVRHALDAAAGACGARTVLVVGSNWREVCSAGAPLPGFFAYNDDWPSGMGSSIAAGVRAVRRTAEAVLLVLADQPLVTVAHLEALAARWRAAPDAIVATGFAGVGGPPALFPAAYFAELASLQGDRGARAVLEGAGRRVFRVAFEPAAIDVDRPEDLTGLP